MVRNLIRKNYSNQELTQVLQAYMDKGYTTKEIAIAMNSSERSVTRWKSELGLAKSTVVPFDVETAVEDYDKGLTANEIARKHNVSVETVSRRLEKAGIVLSREEGIRRRNRRHHDTIWSDIEFDLNSGFLKSEIIRKYSISAPSLNRLMKRHAYTKSFVGDLSDVHAVLASKDSITNVKRKRSIDLYINAILEYVSIFQTRPTVTDLAKYMELSVQTVASWFKVGGYQSLLAFSSHLSYNARFVCKCLDDMGITYDLNRRDLISPQEIDIWIESLNVGIEINPVTSHSVNHNRRGTFPKNYHQGKSLICLDKGIRLIHIFDWDITEMNDFSIMLHSLLYPQLMLDGDEIILDLNKPLTTEKELLLNGFVRDTITPPVEHLANRNSCKITDVVDRNTVSVFDAGGIIYKHINQ